MCPKDADGTANSVDPDLTQPTEPQAMLCFTIIAWTIAVLGPQPPLMILSFSANSIDPDQTAPEGALG